MAFSTSPCFVRCSSATWIDPFHGPLPSTPTLEILSLTSLALLPRRSIRVGSVVAGLGGLITLPVTLPVEFTALWLTQARLAGAIAHLRGYDVRSDEVRSVVLLSLVGSSATEALSQAGVQIGTKSAVSAIKQVPGRVLIQINKMVGFRLITKAGTKGIVNLTKLAPVVGGVIGGGINFTSTRAVGAWAKKNFPATDDAGASAPAAPDGAGQKPA
jgi:hypothetical protein